MSARHQQARFQEAIEAIELFLGCVGDWIPVWFERDANRKVDWRRAGPGSTRELVDQVQRHDELWSYEMTFGVGRRRRRELDLHRSTILWCRIEGSEQLKRARWLKPFPTLVLQEGSSTRRLLIWALARPVSYSDCERLNRRIAYKVGAVQKHAVPETLRIPAPGTCLRMGRARPIPIVVGRLTTDTYLAEQVAGRLKDPPEHKWWELPNVSGGSR